MTAGAWDLPLGGGAVAHVRFSSRAAGDFAVTGPDPTLTARRRALVDRPWTWLRQVHGAGTVTVGAPGDGAGREADAAVTAVRGAALAVHVADCAPVALVAPEGIVGVVHAGWRGVVAGVVEAAAAAMRAEGASTLVAVVGPCIHAECYEFGAEELDVVASRLGDHVRARSALGSPALDLPAAVTTVLDRCEVEVLDVSDTCTACHADTCFSHRARGDQGRHALVAWLEAVPLGSAGAP